MPCNPKCLKTASLASSGGPRIMVSVAGNLKFPIPHTPHPQCKECVKEEYQQILDSIAFEGHEDLLEKFKKLKGKF